MTTKHLIKLVEIKKLLTNDFQKVITKENFENEKQLNAALYEFFKLNLPFNVPIKKEVRTEFGNFDILIDDTYILELKYADTIGTLDRGISEIIRYKKTEKSILMTILDVGKLQEETIKKYVDYYKQIGADTIVVKSFSKRKRSTSIASLIRNNFIGQKFFTVDNVLKVLNLNKSSLEVALSRLEKRGAIERIEKGKYLIIPLGAEKGKYTLHEFVIASILIEPCTIAYWSALNFYGLTEQIPRVVFIQTTARKKQQEKEIFGIRYKIIRIKETKFFGIRKEWIEDTEVSITDKEKTVIDCLDKPQYCGGIIEVAKALKNEKLNAKRLSEYAVQIGNTGVIRRLGYLCDTFHIKIKLSEITTRNYLCLDPTMPHNGVKNAKWHLIVNIAEELTSLE